MPTLVFTTDLRDMNPDDLADKLAAQFNLTTLPRIDIAGTEITITHPQATEQNRTAIQNIINAYTLDPVRASLPSGGQGALLAKAQKALTANATFLAIGSPTAAQVRDQTILLTKEMNALIKLALGQVDDLTGT